MQFTTVILSILSAAATAFAASGTAAYDTTYDTGSLSTLSIACSDGINGLNTKGYPTLGSLPGFPRVGASSEVAGWGSSNCGKCYTITWQPDGAPAKSINVIAVDHAGEGWVLSRGALDQLTGGLAVMVGRFPVTWTPAPQSSCGF